MYTEARKIQLIAEVLKANSLSTLEELENVLMKSPSKKTKAKELSIYDFVGVISKKEAAQMKQAIEETSETIDAGDWK
jgi:predicted nucleotidyltransferase